MNSLPSIMSLLLSSRPPAVIGTVRPVIVSSIKGETFLVRWLHVISEILEFKPAFTHGYAASAIQMKRVMLWLSASTYHVLMDAIESGVGASVCGVGLSDLFIPVAATAKGFSAPKIVSSDSSCCSTFADAIPSWSILSSFGSRRNHRPPTKLLTS
jgi:hypothetical protein